MINLKAICDWIAGVDSVKDAKMDIERKPFYRLKNEAELREHVIVSVNERGQYIVYTHDFLTNILPTEKEKQACFIFGDKMKAIAAARHLIRKLHSTQKHPVLVFFEGGNKNVNEAA